MNEKSLGISQQTLVSNTEVETVPARRFYQYAASLASTLGALAAGLTLGWSSSAGPDGKDLASQYGIDISISDFSWIDHLLRLAQH